MISVLATARSRCRRVLRVRKNLRSQGRLRLSVHTTGRHVYAQIIDDQAAVTIVSASTCEDEISKSLKSGGNVVAASVVGKIIAERAIAAGVVTVIFDRGGRKFHGRVAAVANSARSVGLRF